MTRGDVRRAKLYYLRNLRGKAAKIMSGASLSGPRPDARYALRVTTEDRDHVRRRIRRGGVVPARSRKKHLPVWQETILLLAIALALAVVIKAVFVQAFTSRRSPWSPAGQERPDPRGEGLVLVRGSPQRGDVVVPRPRRLAGPRGVGRSLRCLTQLMATIGLYPSGTVKRVIGVAGDTIECCDEEGRISVNGKPLDETPTSSRPAPTATGR